MKPITKSSKNASTVDIEIIEPDLPAPHELQRKLKSRHIGMIAYDTP